MKVSSQSTIDLKDIVQFPLPGMNIPGALTFSPDGRFLTYLFSPDGGLVRQLYGYDFSEGTARLLIAPNAQSGSEENLSLAEKLRRERLRQRELGITSYQWASKTGQMLIPQPDGLYIFEGEDGGLRPLLTNSAKPLQDAHFSPDGAWVAFVQDAELYVLPTAAGEPQQISSGARGTGKTNGLAEYIAQEELGRRRGYWWSPDSQKLAFVQVDETHIPVYRIVHQGKDAVGDAAQEDHHYPFAGMPNAKVRLGVVGRDGGDVQWLDLGENEDIYLARVKWLPNGRLTAQILNREQTQLDLVEFDLATGQKRLLLRETSDVWINLHDIFHPIKKLPEHAAGGFIWASERTGFRHLYLYDADGEEIRPLTHGDWQVDSLAGVDAENEVVYFMASQEAPTESHLYRVWLLGGEPHRLTTEPGLHSVVLDVKRNRFVAVQQSAEQPPSIVIRSLADGRSLNTIYIQPDDRTAQLNLPTPEIVTLQNRDGVQLYGAIYRPPATFGDGPFPTIVSVYGGPHAQRVTNSWGLTVDMRAQYLASQGFLVFKLDNQGSARRGLAFEAPIKHNMGDVEVADQVDGVRWLVAQGLADPARVGIYGWSYGGYLSLMCLARAADTFRVAVAGAPVTHWDGYDTGYTERYMGLPQQNPSGYDVSSVMHHLDKMTGKLLLVHGLIDENVHFRHTARLINALIAARQRYDLLLFPDERHMPRQADGRFYMEEQIADYFKENL
ncbi:MAG: S9 family peptidase [Ardenticatenaceae bacterium]|nr:S9 family peptidase [Anaerolineales bacterium]MCB8941282.1 S9 family peptidase [Ardenticatenaceae bacterium]MCB8972637.1 S9 family peptidase [Ardenticatenaceae bacterium]